MAAARFIAIRLSTLRLALIPLIAALLLASALPKRAQAPGRKASLPLAGRVIVIDPGHGGIDPGCHMGEATEKEISLDVGLMLAERLKREGADVFVTRTEDVELSSYGRTQRTRHGRDLEARVLLAESYKGEIFVSLHVNAAKSGAMGGGMVFYHRGSEQSRRLAQNILARLKEVVPGNQNASLPADFYVLRHAKMPAVLVEMGFLTHRDDRALLLSAAGKERLAQAVAQGIFDYFAASGAPEDAETLGPQAPGFLAPGVGGGEAHECSLIPGGTEATAGRARERNPAWRSSDS